MDIPTIQLATTLICCVVSALSFIRSGSSKSSSDAREMGKIEQKLNDISSDVKDIKKQNLESAKMESQTKERLDTLFKWKDSVDAKISKLEDVNGK